MHPACNKFICFQWNDRPNSTTQISSKLTLEQKKTVVFKAKQYFVFINEKSKFKQTKEHERWQAKKLETQKRIFEESMQEERLKIKESN
jgi:hypothetical protein